MKKHAETPAPPRDALNFSSFRVDRRAGRLLRGDQAIPLRPKTWGVLLYLLDHAGVLVSREELLDAVWPGIAVTPDTVTKSIGELRDALGDDARAPRCIETVHRRGFRFIASIAESPSSAAAWSPPSAATLVGRDDELRRLQSLCVEASAGRRQIAFVTAAAGIGKTAIVDAFVAAAAAKDAALRIGRGGCFEQHATREPYMPVLDAIERLAHAPDGAAIVDLLRRFAPSWLAQLPGLTAGEVQPAPADVRPERMGRELAAWAEAMCAVAPLLLVLEDLHWSDPSTVDLLSFLGARDGSVRLMVLATYRPAEVAVQDHPLGQVARALHRQGRAVAIPLHELSGADVQRYLELRFAGASFVDTLAPVVHEYTDGNPLFLGAVVDHMVSRGWILETSPGWALTIEPRRGQLEVPEEARQLIRVQIESVGPADRAVLEVASIAGREFAVPLVASVLGADTDEVETRCERLARARRFLRPAGSGGSPAGGPSRRYAFAHALYREACYADIDDGRRQRLHQRIGEALETVQGERAEDVAAELAHHFVLAGDHARAVRYLAAAAARARRRFASREAVEDLRAALALVPRLPEEQRPLRELELRLALAAPLADLEGFGSDDLLDNGLRAHALCRGLGTLEQQFQLVYTLCHLYAGRADPVATEPMAAELEDLARRLGTAEHLFLAESALLRLEVNGCRFAAACRRGEQLAARRGSGATPRTTFGTDPLVGANGHYALALWMTGDGARARSVSEATIADAERGGHPFTLASAYTLAALVALLLGEDGEAGARAEQALVFSREYAFAQWDGAALALRGWARARRGELREGTADLEEARRAALAANVRIFIGLILAGLAATLLQAGAIEAGLAIADEGIASGESNRDRVFLPELYRLKAELLLAGAGARRTRSKVADPLPEEVDRCLRRALELARATDARSLELRAAISLARARPAAVGARLDPLREVVATITPDPDNRELALARQLLAGPARGRSSKPRRTG